MSLQSQRELENKMLALVQVQILHSKEERRKELAMRKNPNQERKNLMLIFQAMAQFIGYKRTGKQL